MEVYVLVERKTGDGFEENIWYDIIVYSVWVAKVAVVIFPRGTNLGVSTRRIDIPLHRLTRAY